MSQPTIRIAKWDEFQHYKNRNPPWIKLHRQLLNKREWRALDAFAAKLLIELWLLASESNSGNIELLTADLAWHLRYDDSDHARIAGALLTLASGDFITLSDHDASAVLAGCQQDATPEGEERERESSVLSEPAKIPPNDEATERPKPPAPKPRDPEADWKAHQPEIAGAIREHAWLGNDPPDRPVREESRRQRWHMGRELDIAKALLKQYSGAELVGGIQTYREAHDLAGDEKWSLAWCYAEGNRWRIDHAVKRWREKQIDAIDDPLVLDLTRRMMESHAA